MWLFVACLKFEVLFFVSATIALHLYCWKGILLRSILWLAMGMMSPLGWGGASKSLCRGGGRSAFPSVLNYTVDQSVVDPPLAPTVSSTPITQS